MNAARTDPSPINITPALPALAAVAVIWLPFAWNTSPAKALLYGDLWYLAAPFLLAVPIAAARVWMLASGSLPAGARWGARILAGCSMAVTALLYATRMRESIWAAGIREWLGFLLPLAVAAAWVLLMFRWRPRGRTGGAAEAIALMELAWLVNAVGCLVAFMRELQTGGYIALAVAAAFAAHVVAMVRGRRQDGLGR